MLKCISNCISIDNPMMLWWFMCSKYCSGCGLAQIRVSPQRPPPPPPPPFPNHLPTPLYGNDRHKNMSEIVLWLSWDQSSYYPLKTGFSIPNSYVQKLEQCMSSLRWNANIITQSLILTSALHNQLALTTLYWVISFRKRARDHNLCQRVYPSLAIDKCSLA